MFTMHDHWVFCAVLHWFPPPSMFRSLSSCRFSLRVVLCWFCPLFCFQAKGNSKASRSPQISPPCTLFCPCPHQGHSTTLHLPPAVLHLKVFNKRYESSKMRLSLDSVHRKKDREVRQVWWWFLFPLPWDHHPASSQSRSRASARHCCKWMAQASWTTSWACCPLQVLLAFQCGIFTQLYHLVQSQPLGALHHLFLQNLYLHTRY